MRTYDNDGHYSDLVKSPTGHFKLSGIKSWDRDVIQGETVSEQFCIIINHLNHALSIHNLKLKNINFVTVFLSDLTLYSELNEIYAKSFPHKPCRSVTGATLRNGALVEIVAEGWSDA